MWHRTRLTEMLGLEWPIVQAPMAGSTTPELAAAVSNAGGLGSLGCAMLSPDGVGEAVAAMRARTNGAFNLNFFAHRAETPSPETLRRTMERLAPHYAALGVAPPADPAAALPPPEPGFDDAMLERLLDAAPPVVSFHFGLPEGDAVARLKAAGARVLCSATTVAEARAIEAAGADAVIAQGWEAGGHRGAFETEGEDVGVGLFSLLPQIADAVSIPVIAAGGIADGRGVAAALTLGADGVQIGTAYLSCPEAATSETHRRVLREATDAETRLTRAHSGRPARARATPYTAEMARDPAPLVPFPQLRALTAPLREAEDTSRSLDYQFLLYGQSAAMNRELPAAELTRRLAEETGAALARFH